MSLALAHGGHTTCHPIGLLVFRQYPADYRLTKAVFELNFSLDDSKVASWKTFEPSKLKVSLQPWEPILRSSS